MHEDRREPAIEAAAAGFTITFSAPSIAELRQLLAATTVNLSGHAPASPRAHRWTKADEAVVVEMRTAGASWREIGDALARTEKAIIERWYRLTRTR